MRPISIAISSMLAAASFNASAAYVLIVPLSPFQSSEVEIGLSPLPRLAVLRGEPINLDIGQVALTGNAIRSKVTWQVSGTFPQGVGYTSPAKITGAANESGSFEFAVKASYRGHQVSQAYGIDVAQIQVQLSVPASLLKATAGVPYSLDLKPYATISGDAEANLHADQLTWSLASGTLPSGLQLDAAGVISGTPTGVAGQGLNLSVDYKGAQQTALAALPVDQSIVMAGATRQWSDATVAASCNDYRRPQSGYAYVGAIGSGTYKIKPGAQALDVYCDMETEGGGWTLVLAADFRGMYPEAHGIGTSAVCATLQLGCLTQGTSNMFRGTSVKPVDYLAQRWDNGFSAATQTDLGTKAKPYIRDNITSPGTPLYELMTDNYMGWAHPGNTKTDPSDNNHPDRVFYTDQGSWSDGNWHGCKVPNSAGCGTHTYQAGSQFFGAVGTGSTQGWGHHYFQGAPTLNSSTQQYTLAEWTYMSVAGSYANSRLINRQDFERIRWTMMVR